MTAFPQGTSQLVLESPRLKLRPLSPPDAAGLLAVFGDPEVVRYYDLPLFRSNEDGLALVEESLEGFRTGESMRWAITEASNPAGLLGTVSLHGIHPRHRYAEVGFAVRRDRWGEGLAPEALELLAEASFASLALNRLEAFVDPRNQASASVLRRVGFSYEGRLGGRYWDGTRFQDDLIFSLQADSRGAGSG